ncbi:MAG: rhodanese-like domain-containing protein, partial [Chloroflexota bacterium]
MMKFFRRNNLLFVALVALVALFGVSQAAVVAQDATPQSAALFEIQPVLVDYLANLPTDFYGIKPDMALVELSKDVKPFLIDVRDEKEIADGGYIAGAVLIPLRTLTQNLDKLP